MEMFNDHKKLFGAALLLFVGLSIFVAIVPAVRNQQNNAPLPGSEVLSGDALAGKHIFISEGCVACHSQQVRNVDMDNVWGTRPGVAADYAHNTRMSWWMNTATLMGTERTGPDLTDIGNRLPGADWHLLHLFNPRIVVDQSIMPAYPWLFEWKANPAEGDKVVGLPDEMSPKGKSLVARKEALQLVAYLQSLRQTPLPDGTSAPEFLYSSESAQPTPLEGGQLLEIDGARLYANNCQACHQQDGKGLKGAFPPLESSAIVLDDNPEILIDIIMNGYDGRQEYGAMPAIGTNNALTAEEVTALINHERTSWGNSARVIPLEEVKQILEQLKNSKPDL
jgi:cytochrome c oxidase cbb3-type subunit 2